MKIQCVNDFSLLQEEKNCKTSVSFSSFTVAENKLIVD